MKLSNFDHLFAYALLALLALVTPAVEDAPLDLGFSSPGSASNHLTAVPGVSGLSSIISGAGSFNGSEALFPGGNLVKRKFKYNLPNCAKATVKYKQVSWYDWWHQIQCWSAWIQGRECKMRCENKEKKQEP